VQVKRELAQIQGEIASMSLQQIKAKLLAIGLFTVSAGGTLALFGCVPVIARIATNPPFSMDKIEAFLIQQAAFSTETEDISPSLAPIADRNRVDRNIANRQGTR
jgi:hypothetical protein